jgi:hypothetical protein
MVTRIVRGRPELFKQFTDNEDFKRWMTARVFELACAQTGAGTAARVTDRTAP